MSFMRMRHHLLDFAYPEFVASQQASHLLLSLPFHVPTQFWIFSFEVEAW